MDDHTRSMSMLPILDSPGQTGGCGGTGCDSASRRRFLEGAVTFALGTMTLTVIQTQAEERTTPPNRQHTPVSPPPTGPMKTAGPVYGFLVDSGKCIGSGKCLVACRVENNVPEGYHRTWVERYVHLKDGSVRVDTVPETGLQDLAIIDAAEVERSYFVPKLCNHCEDAPCNQVCPVHAAFTSPDGFVLVDPKQCIGCAYCVQACPYGVRFINPETGTADKCTWCYHRVKHEEQPACVEACPVGARLFGRLDDPQSEISRRLAGVSSHVLKEYLGTHPKTRYLSLSQEVI